MGEIFGLVADSVLLGVGLSMDAFSVSLANGLHEPGMSRRRLCAVAGVYGGFQALMPLTGWALVRTAAERFRAFHALVPWIGAVLLAWIGGRMLLDGLRGGAEDDAPPALGIWELLAQGVATSIDALSVGFAIAGRDLGEASASAGIIGAVTFCVCAAGLAMGRQAGTWLSRRASALGGLILIGIGAEMLLRVLL